ncbi:MAG: outer membrane lipoprotein carrier protein LolA [Treponema sp.]|jgi:hypothetical protein|nr:outer membrane lipoprotein carrier protein LolA [Treponema sp.]
MRGRLFVWALALGFMSVPAPLQAQTPDAVFQHPLSAAALPRFHEVCGVLSSHPLIKGSFTQRKTIKRLDRSLDSSGNFIIDSRRGMVWETLKPYPSTMAVGRDYLVQSSPGRPKTTLSAAGNEVFLRLASVISAVFSGNAQLLLDNFGDFFVDSGGGWTLGLIPSENAVRSFAERIILEGDTVIRRITLFEQNGDTIRYELSGHVFPEALSPDEAAFFSPD